MTCIVGVVDENNDKVVIGGDTAGVSGNTIVRRSDPKVFRVKEFVIGCTTSFRMIQLLRFKLDPPDVGDKDIFEYMCTSFVDAVRECFKEGGYLQKEEGGDEKGGSFLVGYKNHLFEIGSDFQVGIPMDGQAAIGCGDEFALGCLFGQQAMDYGGSWVAEDVVKCALSAASYHSTGVYAPFVILST